MVEDMPGGQYQSLYRRYRPQRFAEVRGQDHVVLALRNAVRDDRVAHAYLFSGPRGTGKTSTARILAKALNCRAPESGEPCGRCDSCLDIARGASLDVHELDAASNNGVDAMRDLVARAALATPGKWKVYIVDEVHMLSTAASNALLKTLEEPPSHVVFVLATTDPQKVLPTIRSRTQHYEFHLLEPDVLSSLLAEIAADARLDLPDGGIDAAIRRGHGSARDAVSALDQVAAAGIVEDDSRHVRELVGAVAERDSGAALRAVAVAVAAGRDAGRLGEELVDALRSVFLSTVAPGLVRPGGARAGVAALAGSGAPDRPPLSPARCVRAMELLGAALVDMKDALDPRITLEVALVRLTDPEVDDSPAALLDRLERLEHKVHELSSQLAAAGPPPTPVAPIPPPAFGADALGAGGAGGTSAELGGARPALGAFRTQRSKAAEAPAPAGPASAPATAGSAFAPAPAGPASTLEAATPAPVKAPLASQDPARSSRLLPSRDDLVTAWGDHVLSGLRPRVKAVCAVGRFLAIEDGTAVFALPNPAHVEHAEPFRGEVAAALSAHFGCPIDVRLVSDAEQGEPSPGGVAADERASATASISGGGRERGRPSQGMTRGSSPLDEGGAAALDEGGAAALDEVEELEPGTDAGPHDSLMWAATRLLDAFPGAEEVT